MTTIYLIRHSAPFIQIDNYEDYNNILWNEYNNNMILSIEGEEKAKKLTNINELKEIDEIYSSNSPRALATAKYLSEINNIKIKLDKRIDERIFGINKLKELPNNFNKLSFDNRNYKINNGESLNEVTKRFNSFIKEKSQTNKKIVIVLHGIILLSYLQTICDHFTFDGKIFNIKHKGTTILEGNPKNPSIYKITFTNTTITNIENIKTNS